MIILVENEVEISQDKPGETQGGNFGKLFPKKTLVAELGRIVNHRNKKTISGVRGNNKMKSSSRNSN